MRTEPCPGEVSSLHRRRHTLSAPVHQYHDKGLTGLRLHHPAWELAEYFSISETSLKNYFRGVYGQNISVYLREMRMNKAGELLASTRLSVAEIAAQVGYLNQSKFASVFKKHFGVSPLEYRRTRHLDS